jgi:small subunit ribosomal protein S15
LPLDYQSGNCVHKNHLNNIGMYLAPEEKQKIFAKHGKSKEDTGTAEGQIALFTYRIEHLTQHLKRNHKDYNTERSLVKLVGKRRSLLDYLMKKDVLRYRAIVKELGLRK